MFTTDQLSQRHCRAGAVALFPVNLPADANLSHSNRPHSVVSRLPALSGPAISHQPFFFI